MRKRLVDQLQLWEMFVGCDWFCVLHDKSHTFVSIFHHKVSLDCLAEIGRRVVPEGEGSHLSEGDGGETRR